MKLVYLCILLILILSCYNSLYTQEYEIYPYIIANGGSNTGDDNYMIEGTLGQTFIGEVTDDTDILHQIGFWIMDDEIATGVDDDRNLLDNYTEVLVYPNPFLSSINLKFRSNQIDDIVVFEMYDLLGYRIGKWNFEIKMTGGDEKTLIDVYNLPSGIYNYRISIGERIFLGKLIKID